MDVKKILSRLVQVGTVTVVDPARRRVRAKFQDTGIPSGWLYVLQRSGTGLSISPDGNHTHTVTDTYTGGGTAGTAPNHDHTGSCTSVWLPKVNDTVLVLHLPVLDGDGFILGGI